MGEIKRGQLKKDRDIPFSDWLQIMQLEYISYRLRAKLYRHHKDIKKFNDIAEKKKPTILKVTEDNHLPSIFDSLEIREHLLSKFFNEYGLPNFRYRDEYQRNHPTGRNRWDRCYYFSPGTSVKVITDNGIVTGIIDGYDWKNDIVMVNQSMSVPSINVTRIFDKKFIKELI